MKSKNLSDSPHGANSFFIMSSREVKHYPAFRRTRRFVLYSQDSATGPYPDFDVAKSKLCALYECRRKYFRNSKIDIDLH